MRALVVDDSRPIRSIIAKILRGLSFETCEAANGLEALRSLEQNSPFDVVTVNWEMPVMNGLEFASAVRGERRFHNLPMLMISSESDPRRIELAMKAGVDEYIVKPCTRQAVAAKLSTMGVLKESDPPPATNTRVLLVDDSSVVRRVVSKTLGETPDLEVVGAAKDGIEGLEMIRSLRPHVVVLDVDMPRMDGLELLRQLRSAQIQVPVLMFSSRTERGARVATDALLLGAKDFVLKPGGASMSDLQEGRHAIVDRVIPRIRSLRQREDRERVSQVRSESKRTPQRVDLVVLGASTGGPVALAQLVADEHLRTNLHAPIVIAQHMPTLFTKHLASRLAQDSGLDIAEAEDGELLKPGMIRFAPGGRHAAVIAQKGAFVSVVHDQPPVNSCRPSVDVLLQSSAAAAQEHLLAVILTGMGHDGKEGCRSVRAAGGWVIAQDEETSVVWGMPGSVAGEGLADLILPLDKIGAQIGRQLRVGRCGGAA